MSEQSPFAILFLANLKIIRRATKDEWRDTLADLKRCGVPVVPLVWHHGANQYSIPQEIEL